MTCSSMCLVCHCWLCRLTVVYESSPPWNLASRDIVWTEWNRNKPTIKTHFWCDMYKHSQHIPTIDLPVLCVTKYSLHTFINITHVDIFTKLLMRTIFYLRKLFNSSITFNRPFKFVSAGKSKLHLLWPIICHAIKSITRHIRWP